MSHSDPSAVEQQRLAYESLCCYLDKHENEVLEIEILPPAITPPNGLLLEDGSSLGVPKKVLAVAFLEARRAFFDNKDNSQTDPKVYHIIIRQPMCSDMFVYENFVSLADPPSRLSKRPRLCCCLTQSISRLQTSASAEYLHWETQATC